MSSIKPDSEDDGQTGTGVPDPTSGRSVRRAFRVFAWLLAACVVVQVFFAGLAVFVSSSYWEWHRTFVHVFELLPLVMLVLAFAGRFPVRTRWLTAGAFGLIFAQYATANIGGVSGAIHPVIALLFFFLAVAVALARTHAHRGG